MRRTTAVARALAGESELHLRPRAGNSMVEVLLDRGQDVYLVEWGVPDAADAENSFETYCDDYLPEIVNFVVANSSADDLNMLGYCFGGVLTLLYAAGHDRCAVASLTHVGHTHRHDPDAGAAEGRQDSSFDPALVIDESGNVPGTVIGNAIRSLDPTAEFAITCWRTCGTTTTSPPTTPSRSGATTRFPLPVPRSSRWPRCSLATTGS
ncbi:MAG: alpha/beta fold hydrolase [Acidimicrobiales bacterium]